MRAARSLLLGTALALAAAPRGAAEPVKLLRPDQYRTRIVAAKKGRVLLVNFWATWCLPCRDEMPKLVAAAKAFSSTDLAVVLVATDTPKTSGEVPKFLSETKVPFVCWQARASDPQLIIDAVDKSWDGTLPYTIVYHRTGEVAARLAGAQTEASFTDAIRKALGAPR